MDAVQEAPQQTVQPRTFYSTAGALVISISVGQRVIDGAGTKVVGQKVAEFSPMADGFGRLVTDDPEIIAKLDARMKISGDVFDSKEYGRRTTPADIQLKMSQDENKRLIADNNRLLAQLSDQGRVPVPPKKDAPSPK